MLLNIFIKNLSQTSQESLEVAPTSSGIAEALQSALPACSPQGWGSALVLQCPAPTQKAVHTHSLQMLLRTITLQFMV